MTYSVVVAEKEEDLTTEIIKLIKERGITQAITTDGNSVMFRGEVLKDSITNLLYQIVKSKSREVNNEVFSNESKMEKCFDDFFGKGKLSESNDIDQLQEIEEELLNTYNRLNSYSECGIMERIGDIIFCHDRIGAYYYLFSLDEKDEGSGVGTMGVNLRIYIGDMEEADFSKKYYDDRLSDHKGRFLPYGVIRLDELLRQDRVNAK